MNDCKFLTLSTLIITFTGANANTLDSIYDVLDEEIAQADNYILKKEQDISSLQEKIKNSRIPESRFELTMQLYDEYSSYDDQKAKSTLADCLRQAEEMADERRIALTRCFLAYQNSISGYYSEATHWLDEIDEDVLDATTLEYYHYACTHTYGELGRYSDDETLSQYYYGLSDLYREKFFSVADTTSSYYYQRRISNLISAQKAAEAEAVCREWNETVVPNSHDYAILAYYMSEYYRIKGDEVERRYWLAQSALCDCRNAVTNQASLWTLADLVAKDGNLERSNRYIEYSWMCTTKFGGHTRSWQVSPVITTINNNYRDKLSKNNRNLSILLGAVSVLAILFLASLLFLYKRNKLLAAARNELRRINGKLNHLNAQLNDSNRQMKQVNLQLNDSNRVKDEYIGRFLDLCSRYIDKLDAYRLKINRRLKANQYKELMRMTSSDELRETETRELFANFDAVFLRLYPNFVEEFNNLLRPEFHQQLGTNSELSTDMRMAALIRLGIDDSSHIASFLRLTPNTIYNYRARLKSRAAGNREDFEQRIREIGLQQTHLRRQ